jgi:single-strand DNA-binding protein
VARAAAVTQEAPAPATVNEVRLVGRVSGPTEQRELPSGDLLVSVRVVVARPVVPARGRADGTTTRAVVDTIDVACWSGRTRAAALRLDDGDHVEVQGALRRRFFRAGGAAVSRYEVEAAVVRRVRT